MAYDFSKFNKGSKVCRPSVDNSDFEFVKIGEFAGKVIHVDGWFFTEGDYGKQVVIIGEGKNINMPGRAVEDIEALGSDPDAVAAMLNGELVITDIRLLPSKSKGKHDTYSYSFGNVANI